MSHQPLALKYRPAMFADVISQDHVTRTLQNALDQSRIAQAYLFAGPRGSGKTTTARLLARALNCETGISGEPCGSCENCVSIAGGRSLDVIEIDAASNRGIDDIKELRETVKYAAAQGRYKVYIVDEVHQLSKDAFNAFLKTLEEPPKHVVFVLATTEPHKILPTILSRCQRFDFRPIPLVAIRDRIEWIARQESFQLDEDTGFAIAKKADGSLRDALSLLDQVVAFAGETIDIASLRRLIGIPEEERFLELTEALSEADPAVVLTQVRNLREAGYDLETFYSGFLEHLRNCLLFALGEDYARTEVPERYHDRYRKVAARLGTEDLLRMLTLATDEEITFRRSSQQGLVLEVLLIRLALLDRAVDLDRLLGALASEGKLDAGGSGGSAVAAERGARGTQAPVDRSKTGPAAPAASPAAVESTPAVDDPAPVSGPLTLEALECAWHDVLDAVHSVRPIVAGALRAIQPTGCSASVVELTLPSGADFRLEQLSARGTLDPLSEELARRWNFAGTIEVRVAESTPGDESTVRVARPTRREREREDALSRLAQDDRLRQIAELFDANIVRARRSPPAQSS